MCVPDRTSVFPHHCVLQVLTPEQQRAFCRIGALIRGFLTRRLLNTEKVKHLSQTVVVSSLFNEQSIPLKVHQTCTPAYVCSGYAGVHPIIPDGSAEQRRLLGTRSLAAGAGQGPGEDASVCRPQSSIVLQAHGCLCSMPQLRAALYDIHDIFFVLPLGDRLALLQQDRELRAERKLRGMVLADCQ